MFLAAECNVLDSKLHCLEALSRGQLCKRTSITFSLNQETHLQDKIFTLFQMMNIWKTFTYSSSSEIFFSTPVLQHYGSSQRVRENFLAWDQNAVRTGRLDSL